MPASLVTPPGVPAPVGAYSHAAVIEAGARQVHLSGQIGVGADGKVPTDLVAEAEQVWRNIEGVLAGVGLTTQHIAKIVTYVVAGSDLAPIRAARAKALGDLKPASTLVVVAALAGPEYHYEVEVIAVG
jgi:2-iminobutanoate/2-iminopropanoate deaminase